MDGRVQTRFFFYRWVSSSGCAGATPAVVGISAELIVFGCSGFVAANAGVLPHCFLAGCWRFSSPPSSATKWVKRRGLEGPCVGVPPLCGEEIAESCVIPSGL